MRSVIYVQMHPIANNVIQIITSLKEIVIMLRTVLVIPHPLEVIMELELVPVNSINLLIHIKY